MMGPGGPDSEATGLPRTPSPITPLRAPTPIGDETRGRALLRTWC
jgi:hypothetical protein